MFCSPLALVLSTVIKRGQMCALCVRLPVQTSTVCLRYGGFVKCVGIPTGRRGSSWSCGPSDLPRQHVAGKFATSLRLENEDHPSSYEPLDLVRGWSHPTLRPHIPWLSNICGEVKQNNALSSMRPSLICIEYFTPYARARIRSGLRDRCRRLEWGWTVSQPIST